MVLARHVVTRLVDDLDGSPAVTTLSFSLDGVCYEIDLSTEHHAALQRALAPFVTAARTVPGRRTQDTAAASTTTPTTEATAKVTATKTTAPESPAKEAATTEPPVKRQATGKPAMEQPVTKRADTKRAAQTEVARENGRAAASHDPVAQQVSSTRPAAVTAPPFQQPKHTDGGADSSASPPRPKPRRAPLVADPFNLEAHRPRP
jgi:Lsr2